MRQIDLTKEEFNLLLEILSDEVLNNIEDGDHETATRIMNILNKINIIKHGKEGFNFGKN